MSLLKEFQGYLSITFILDVAVRELKGIFRHEGFKEVRTPPQPVSAPPGIVFGPPRIPIAIFGNTKITYVGDRFRLEFQGPMTEILELKELIPSLFKKNNYNLSSMTRFTEFSMGFQPIKLPGIVEKIRSLVTVKNLDKLNEVCECQLKTFNVSLSNLNSPLSDEWFHIRLHPDINRPHEIMLFQIIKRTPKLREMNLFLNKINDILNTIRDMLSA